MLKTLYEAIRKDGAPIMLKLDGREYTDKPVYPLKAPEPSALTLTTLTGVVDYLKANTDTPMVRAILNGKKTQTRRPAKIPLSATRSEAELTCHPYRQGDLLWVRETWCESPKGYLHKASSRQSKIRWRPSIHMPRKACRLFLEVDDIEIHRLQDISEEDAKAEGVKPHRGITFISPYKAGFQVLWLKLYTSKNTWWGADPWVYCTKFHIAELKE